MVTAHQIVSDLQKLTANTEARVLSYLKYNGSLYEQGFFICLAGWPQIAGFARGRGTNLRRLTLTGVTKIVVQVSSAISGGCYNTNLTVLLGSL